MDDEQYYGNLFLKIREVKFAIEKWESFLKTERHPRRKWEEKRLHLRCCLRHLYDRHDPRQNNDHLLDEFEHLVKVWADHNRAWEDNGERYIREYARILNHGYDQVLSTSAHLLAAASSPMAPLVTQDTNQPYTEEDTLVAEHEDPAAAEHLGVRSGHRATLLDRATGSEADVVPSSNVMNLIEEEEGQGNNDRPHGMEQDSAFAHEASSTLGGSDNDTTQSMPLKRVASSDFTKSLRPSKRQHQSMPTIEYNEVFQNGHADQKYIIIQLDTQNDDPGDFCILRCEEHDIYFTNRPLQGAGLHLTSRAHGGLDRSFNTIISHFGVRVLNCDLKGQEVNNAIAKAYFERGHRAQQRNASRGPSRRASTRGNSASDGILDPEPGSVYFASYGKSNRKWPVVILPMMNGDSHHKLGDRTRLADLGLLDDVPSCWDRDSLTGRFRRLFPEYMDGAPKAKERSWPVMFADRRKFWEGNGSVGWVRSKDLSEYVPEELNGNEETRFVDDFFVGSEKYKAPDPASIDRGETPESPTRDVQSNRGSRNGHSPSSAYIGPCCIGPALSSGQTAVGDQQDGYTARSRKMIDGLLPALYERRATSETHVSEHYASPYSGIGNGSEMRASSGQASDGDPGPSTRRGMY